MNFSTFRTVLPAALLAAGLTLNVRAAESTPEVTPKPKWESSAFLGFSLTSGNSDTLLFSSNVKTEKKDKDHEWAFGADGAYGENDGDKNNQTLHGFGQYNRLFSERWFGYIRVDGLHDDIADLDYRVTLSPGIGYYVIKKPNTSLAFEVGPGYVFEKRGGEENDFATLRLAERFQHKFSDRARVWQSLEFLPEVEDFGNYVANAEIGVAASLSKNLELNVVLQDTYVSDPASGRDNNDLKLISGIRYKF